MTGQCHNRKLARLLHAYELGLLREPERAEFEAHVIECDACAAELASMTAATRMLRLSASARSRIREATRDTIQDRIGLSSRPSISWRVVVPVALTIALTLFLVLKDWQVTITPSSPVMAGTNSVAVLPFDNLTRETDTTHLGDVLANLLVTGLSEYRSLQVVSSQYVFDLAARIASNRRISPAEGDLEIARAAGARFLVTGAITQVQPCLAVSVQVVDVGSGLVKDAFRDTAMIDEDVFAAVDRLTLAISHVIRPDSAASDSTARSVTDVTTTSPEAYEEYVKGCDMMRKAYIDDAAPYFRRALLHDSTFAMAYYYLSSLTAGPERRAMIAHSVKYLDRAGERDKYFIRSRAAIANGDTQQGLQILRDFVARFPDEKEPLLTLGRMLYGLRQCDAARDRLTAAIRLDSSFADAYNTLAYVYDCLGNVVEAFRAVDRYAALRPGEANPYDSRGEIYARNGDLDQAIASYRRALEIKPDLYASLSYLGIMYAFREDFATAESCFIALSTCPIADARQASFLYRAYLPACRGQFDSSLLVLGEILDDYLSDQPSPDLAFHYNYQAILHQAAGRSDDALACQHRSVQAGLGADPNDVNRRWAYLIHLLVSAGRREEANREAGRLKSHLDSLKTTLNSYYSAQGSIALAEDRPDSACYWLQQAAQSNGFYDSYLLAQAYVRNRQPGEAVKRLTKLTDCYTSSRMFWTVWSVELHYWLGIAYEESHWYAEAKAEYRSFLTARLNGQTATPAVSDARRRLERLEQGKSSN